MKVDESFVFGALIVFILTATVAMISVFNLQFGDYLRFVEKFLLISLGMVTVIISSKTLLASIDNGRELRYEKRMDKLIDGCNKSLSEVHSRLGEEKYYGEEAIRTFFFTFAKTDNYKNIPIVAISEPSYRGFLTNILLAYTWIGRNSKHPKLDCGIFLAQFETQLIMLESFMEHKETLKTSKYANEYYLSEYDTFVHEQAASLMKTARDNDIIPGVVNYIM